VVNEIGGNSWKRHDFLRMFFLKRVEGAEFPVANQFGWDVATALWLARRPRFYSAIEEFLKPGNRLALGSVRMTPGSSSSESRITRTPWLCKIRQIHVTSTAAPAQVTPRHVRLALLF